MDDPLRPLLDDAANKSLRSLLDSRVTRAMEETSQYAAEMKRVMEHAVAPLWEHTELMQKMVDAAKTPGLDQLTDAMQRAAQSMGAKRFDARQFSVPMPVLPEPRWPELTGSEVEPANLPPDPPKPAMEVLTRIQERYDAERAEKEDRRHFVEMIVTLQDGSRLRMRSMVNDGDNLIRVKGLALGTDAERDVTVGAHVIQFEFVTIERPPPDLRVVE